MERDMKNHTPRKRFGQNFLIDNSVLQKINDTIRPQANDVMVEIGPGLASMTSLLLESVQKLHVIELDRDLVEFLRNNFDSNRLHVHSGDALKFDFGTIPSGTNNKLRLVGNLPYNISSPLLFRLSQLAPKVQDQHFMLQKEVAERLVAKPGGRSFGRLSVMLQWRYKTQLMFTVPPEAFDPIPKVESAIVRMTPVSQPLTCDQGKLEDIVRKAFTQRRKLIKNCLSGNFTENELIDLGVNPQARPEEIKMELFVALANHSP
jgi:16S rRNA (adenine1518-N6/adenine1519-N6)-dimethyltransferase